MTALKAGEVGRFANRPDLSEGVFLVYGSDGGLVRETARRLVGHFSRGDAGSVVTLDAADIDAEPDRLAMEARTPSLFGDARVIRVRDASRKIAPTIGDLLDDPPAAAIVLEADNLQKNDPLRTLVEKARSGRALPCYADERMGIGQLIRESFASAQIRYDDDVISTMSDILGNDREVTRREVEKLVLFADQSRHISRDDVLALCGDNAALVVDEICDSAGSGEPDQLDAAVTRALAAGTDAQYLLSATAQHFVRLRDMKLLAAGGADLKRNVFPRFRVHFRRQAAVERQIRLWDDRGLADVGSRLLSALSTARRQSQRKDAILRQALMGVCILAMRR